MVAVSLRARVAQSLVTVQERNGRYYAVSGQSHVCIAIDGYNYVYHQNVFEYVSDVQNRPAT